MAQSWRGSLFWEGGGDHLFLASQSLSHHPSSTSSSSLGSVRQKELIINFWSRPFASPTPRGKGVRQKNSLTWTFQNRRGDFGAAGVRRFFCI